MKCNKCGQEFGHGTNCIHCGVDKVEGLGNYHGYTQTSTDISQETSEQSDYQPNESSFTACFSCGDIIPLHSKFCPKCGKSLYTKCPKCGSEYSAQYNICPNCGTNKVDYLEQQEKRRKEENERRIIQNGISHRFQAFNAGNLPVVLHDVRLQEEKGLESLIASGLANALKNTEIENADHNVGFGCVTKVVVSLIIVAGAMIYGFANNEPEDYHGSMPFIVTGIIACVVIYWFYMMMHSNEIGNSAIDNANDIAKEKIRRYKSLNPNDPVSKYL